MQVNSQRHAPTAAGRLPGLLLSLLLFGLTGVQSVQANDDAAKLQELRRALESPGSSETAAPPKRARTRAIVFEADPAAPAAAQVAPATAPAAMAPANVAPPAVAINAPQPAPIQQTTVQTVTQTRQGCANVPAEVRGTPVAFAIQFKVGSAELTPGSERTLSEIGKLFATLIKDRCVIVEGHTDSTGNYDRNLALSRERSESVVAYLTTQSGIQRELLLSVGKGSNDPEKNLDPRDARNRRVVFKVVD